MTNALVLHLQREVLKPDIKVSHLLHQALFVAQKLKIDDMCDFLSCEYHGYSAERVISPFRFLKGELFVDTGRELEPVNLIRDNIIQYHEVRSSIAQIEYDYENNDKGYFQIHVRHDEIERKVNGIIRNNIEKAFSMYGLGRGVGNDIVGAMASNNRLLLLIHKACYLHILNSVRAVIQKWSVSLDDYVQGDNAFTFEQEEKVMTTNNTYNINHLNGILGDIINSEVTQNNIGAFKNNVELLRESLERNKIARDDIDEITEIITQSEVPADSNGYSQPVKNWIGKMINKSVNGTWEVSVATAGSILSQIICRYYGIQ